MGADVYVNGIYFNFLVGTYLYIFKFFRVDIR